jgi:hypothetical protein
MSISKEIIIGADGQITVIDNRVFSSVVENQIAAIKSSASEEILSRYPNYKQSNAALGILDSTEENEIKDRINEIRTYSNTLEDQVRAVVWDGSEQNRVQSCDDVQAIQWNYVPNPNLPKRYTAYQFLLRFTLAERTAYRAAALTDPLVADFMNLAQAAQEIITNDPVTIQGMDYLVAVGLLTQQRRDEILS